MNKLLKYTLLVIGIIGFFSSCQYKFNIEPIIPPPDPMDTIYFSQDILPIWNAGDNCTSCHNTGGTPPDLTPDYAHAAVVPAFVNTATPNESVIYTVADPITSTHGWKKYTSSEAATVLQWIEQGALNN